MNYKGNTVKAMITGRFVVISTDGKITGRFANEKEAVEFIDSTQKEAIKEKINSLGDEIIARYAGAIYANYLVTMNGGLNGYTISSLEKAKADEQKRVLAIVPAYIDAVTRAIMSESETKTESLLVKKYKEWFLN